MVDEKFLLITMCVLILLIVAVFSVLLGVIIKKLFTVQQKYIDLLIDGKKSNEAAKKQDSYDYNNNNYGNSNYNY